MRMSTPYVAALTFIILILLVFASCGKKEEMTAPQNQPPTEPTLDVPSGSPPHGSSNQSINPRLCWSCTDPEGDSIFYDIYFDDVDGSTLVIADQAEHYYEPNTLNYSTTYFWKVVAKDKAGNKTTSPVWVFTTLRAPGLVVSDTLLDFGDIQNQLTFTISNTGDDTLIWNITGDQTWLSVDPSSGTTLDEDDTVTVTVDRTAMMCGDYPASLIVDAGSQADTITVNMQVTGLPTLSVTPGSLNYLAADVVDSLEITNATPECGTLNWSITSPQSWISVNPASGSTDNETDYVIVTVNRAGLCEGTHGGSVNVTSDGGDAGVSLTAQVVVTNLMGSFAPSVSCGNAPLSVTFTSSITGGVPPYTVEWQFGDGGTGVGRNPTHVYSSAGTYEVLAKVTDKCGNSAWLASQGDISVITAGYVILGHDITFTSYNYSDKGKTGAGNWTGHSYTDTKSAHARAWCDDGDIWHRDGEAKAWAMIGKRFTTDRCSGGNSSQIADVRFGGHCKGKLSVGNNGRATVHVYIYLYDLTASVDSLVASARIVYRSITSGGTTYYAGFNGTLANLKIEADHIYRAYIRLYTQSNVYNNIWVHDAAGVDYEAKPAGEERYGAYLDNIRIDFK